MRVHAKVHTKAHACKKLKTRVSFTRGHQVNVELYRMFYIILLASLIWFRKGSQLMPVYPKQKQLGYKKVQGQSMAISNQ